jgi:predicted permease
MRRLIARLVVLRWQEAYRKARGVRLVDELRADTRYGLRWLRRSPAFASAAVLSLALGIGANTAVFSLLDAVLLKTLPVSDPDALVLAAYKNNGEVGYALSYRMFDALRSRSQTFADVIAYSSFPASVGYEDTTTPVVRGQLVSGNYYTMLGVPAALGRLILPEDDRAPGTGAVAVLSHSFWRRQFGGDRRVLNLVVRVNGYPFTIVGVSAPEFFGTRVGESPDISVPLTMHPQARPDVGESWIEGEGSYQFWLEAMGRLRPGFSLLQAQAELRGMFQEQVREFVAFAGPKGQRFATAQLDLQPGSRGLSELRRRFSRPLGVVMAVVVLVLLIACANLANLLMARAAARQREIAVRVSLGAGRARLVRQMLTESLVLAVVGGSVGLLIAWWASQALAASLVEGAGQALSVSLDMRMLAFTLGMSMLTGMLFGLVPAIAASRVDPHAALKSGRDAGLGRGRAGLGRLLVTTQVAASLLLLIGAGLFVRTLVNLQNLDVGFTRETVLMTRLEPRGSNQKNQQGDRLRLAYDDLVARVRALPGVRAASLSGSTPLGEQQVLSMEASVDGRGPKAGEDVTMRLMQIYPSYFVTLGVPMLAGRDLTLADNDPKAQPRVAVINETMARRFFGTPSAALRREFKLGSSAIRMPPGRPPLRVPFTVVGVVGDVRDRSLREPIGSMAYATFAQTPTGRGQMTLLVRVPGDGKAITSPVREQVRVLDPAMPLRDIETVTHRVEASLRQERLVALLASGFGLLALLLASVGLYGVMAYGVARRRAEFGLRMALGARRGDVSWLVLRDTVRLIAFGVALGVPMAIVASGLIARMLFGVTPTDPATLGAAVLVLAAVAMLAGYLPARRASRVDPLVALRHE